MKRLCDGVLLLVAALLAFWLGSLQGRALGGAQEQVAAEQRERQVSARHTAAMQAANARYRRSEAELQARSTAATESLKRTLIDEKNQHDRLVADLRAGAFRLSVPIVASAGAACGAGLAGDPATTAGDWRETRAELAPAAAEDLATIAADGNAAIAQLNACIDRYNDVRQHLNALREGIVHAQAQ
jgi:prophage endopeptidase